MFFHLNCSNCNHPIDNRESYVHIGLCVTPKLYHYLNFYHLINLILDLGFDKMYFDLFLVKILSRNYIYFIICCFQYV